MKKKCMYGLIPVLLCLLLCACSAQEQISLSQKGSGTEEKDNKENNMVVTELADEVDYNSLEKTGQLELEYATQFAIEEYGIYDYITIADDSLFLLVPENAPVPAHIPEDVTVLQQPLDHTYLVSTSVMDFISTIGAMDYIRLSGTKAADWYIQDAVDAMENQSLLYAGKYSAPDYELILSEKCKLAIENTMIYHNPEIKEKLEELGIPVLVEHSSYESHPFGRLEWIKLYGVLYNRQEQAESFYNDVLNQVEPVMKQEDMGKSVAFFYVTANGAISVRKANDYIVQMIQLAGGTYALSDVLEDDNALSNMNIQMEDFYTAAKDADILIYNSTIDGELQTVDDLIAKNMLFADFKAVQDDHVYCTTSNFFQEITGIGDFMVDLGNVLKGNSIENNTYLKKLKEN